MSYGLIARNAAGAVIFDSRDAQGGVCVGGIELAPGASTSIAYPAYSGRTALVLGNFTGSIFSSISYASGYPSVTLSCPSTFIAPLLFLIFMY